MKTLDFKLLLDNLENALKYDVENNKVFGSAYYVYQQDVIELTKCFGTRSLIDSVNVDKKTIFRLASMTKPVTAVAALILSDRGLLSLDDTIDKFLPQFKGVHIVTAGKDLGEPKKMPTIRNLLTHTSGIGGYMEAKGSKMTAEDKGTLDATVDYFARAGLDCEPSTVQAYSGMAAFDVMVKIIELVSGTDFLSFITKEIFDICGMTDTTFIPSAEQRMRMIDMHQRTDGKNDIFQMPYGCVFEDFPATHYLGGAGLVSTLEDYSLFAKMLLEKGKTPQGGIIKEGTFSALCTPQVSEAVMPCSERWGLGVRVITKPEYPYLPVGSFGWSGAYGSHFWVDPENKIVAVYMKNSKFDGGAANESARNFEAAVYSSFKK